MYIIFNHVRFHPTFKINYIRMKNGELKTIKGGYDWEPVGCCFCYDHDLNVMGGMAAFNADDCMQNCHYAGDWIGFYIC